MSGAHGELFNEDLGSEFEFSEERRTDRAKRLDLATKPAAPKASRPDRSFFLAQWSDDERKKRRSKEFLAVDAYSRHKQLVNNYIMYYGGKWSDFTDQPTERPTTELDVIRANHRFLWDDDEGGSNKEQPWAQRLAKKYWDKLFKEYCIADLRLYRENKIGMRWRTEQEVVDGKGQFVCGNKFCTKKDELRSWEVNFEYVEQKERKNALVKLRLCPPCSDMLNYRHQRKEAHRQSKRARRSNSSEKTNKDGQKTSADQSDALSSSPSSAAATSAVVSADESIWKNKPALPENEEKNRDDEFDDYLSDLFL